jgi:hypothetical protein
MEKCCVFFAQEDVRTGKSADERVVAGISQILARTLLFMLNRSGGGGGGGLFCCKNSISIVPCGLRPGGPAAREPWSPLSRPAPLSPEPMEPTG